MPDISPHFCIRRIALTTSYAPILAEIDCGAIMVSCDVDWEYCSDTTLTDASTAVGAGIREKIPDAPQVFRIPFPGPLVRFPVGEGIVYVKAKITPGFMWVHFVR